jgi:hypothetical protein
MIALSAVLAPTRCGGLVVANAPDFRAERDFGRENRAAPPRNDNFGGVGEEGYQRSRVVSTRR